MGNNNKKSTKLASTIVMPTTIKVGEQEIKVVETDLKTLGQIDTENLVISIRRDQPDIGKIITLMHELIHFSDEACKDEKLYKRGLGEKQVENIAGTLTLILLQNNLLNLGKYSKNDITKFLNSCGTV